MNTSPRCATQYNHVILENSLAEFLTSCKGGKSLSAILPFIVDGVLKENNNMLLVTRTSIDDIHSPRLIPWNWVFTGIMKYQRLQPLNQWTLYGIK